MIDNDFVQGKNAKNQGDKNDGEGLLRLRDRLVRWVPPIFFLGCAVFLAYQTKAILTTVSSWTVSRTKDLDSHITMSKQLREEVSNGVTTPSVTAHPTLFDPRQNQIVMKAVKELFDDVEVHKNFPALDGIPLEQTDATIVPLWLVNFSGDRTQMGITEAAYVNHREDIAKNPAGLTIRERPIDQDRIHRLNLSQYPVGKSGMPFMTIGGTPRILLNLGVVNEETFPQLKLTLLHEFIHAHDVPGYNPPFNYVHNDLVYLPEYDSMIAKLHLDVDQSRLDFWLWVWTISASIITIGFFYRANFPGVVRNRD